jgi:hypothetical protein
MKFLREHGHSALVSLGSGSLINCIDNHLRLLLALKLTHYVAIDIEPVINARLEYLFSDDATMLPWLDTHYNGDAQCFLEAIRSFPATPAEQLFGLHCKVVVCQRVLPFLHWEELIRSMTPDLVLQEDLHGCELQNLSGVGYHKCRAGIRHYGLMPFRPWRLFRGEHNLILWRRRDFAISPEVDGRCRGNSWTQAMRAVKGWMLNHLGHQRRRVRGNGEKCLGPGKGDAAAQQLPQ